LDGRPTLPRSTRQRNTKFSLLFTLYVGYSTNQRLPACVGKPERAMARYYFHIKDGADLIKDPEGTELSTPDDARLQALRSARELWADAIKSGRELAADAVVIADEHGRTLTFVPMNEALPKRTK
jgi:hypothetical protein